jgi:hypothetical protein
MQLLDGRLLIRKGTQKKKKKKKRREERIPFGVGAMLFLLYLIRIK